VKLSEPLEKVHLGILNRPNLIDQYFVESEISKEALIISRRELLRDAES